MKDTLKMLGTLTLFVFVAGLLLAATYQVTKAPIDAARQKETLDALKKVMPACDNDVVADARTVTDGDSVWTFYVGRQGGTFSGSAFRSTAPGYGGDIEVLVGLTPEGNVTRIEILAADKETPGLGSKVRQPAFRDRFGGRAADGSARVAVSTDGGDIQGITGATISSRAVCAAVRRGLDVYARRSDEIRGPGSAQ
jgi:electron transport complex protein RnfG